MSSGVTFVRCALSLFAVFAWNWSAQALRWSIKSEFIDRLGKSTLEMEQYTDKDFAIGGTAADGLLPPQTLFYSTAIAARRAQFRLDNPSIGSVDDAADRASMSVLDALKVLPSSSFLWLTLFSIKVSREGFMQDQLPFLRMSYRLGPNEGWIAIRRSRVGLSVFSSLDQDMQNAAIGEFAALVDCYAYFVTVPLLVEVAPEVRDRLVQGLKDASLFSREGLYQRMLENGVRLSIPGVGLGEARPWR